MKRRTSFAVSLIYKKRAKSENPQAIKGSTCSGIVNRQFLVCIPQAKIFLRFRRPLNENFQNLKRQTKSLQIYSVSSWRAKYKLFVSFRQNAGLGRLRFQVSLGYNAIAIVEIG